jgi:hypothetical protein
VIGKENEKKKRLNAVFSSIKTVPVFHFKSSKIGKNGTSVLLIV